MHQGLKIETGRSGNVYRVVITGELDLASAEDLGRALAAAERSEAPRIVLDIDGLEFIDSTGMQAIVRAARRSERGAGRLEITRGSGHVAAMFRLTALDHTLPFVDGAAAQPTAASR